MFRRKNRSNTHLGSGESIESLASSENLYGSRDRLSNTPALFDLFLLGSMTDVNLSGIYTRDPDVQLIDKIEEAQLEGKVSLVAKEENVITLTVSKYGIKVTHKNKKDVLDRHPLYTVAQVIHYVDSFEKNNVAFKIGQVQPGSSVCDCHIFQCQSEEQALGVCAAVKAVYDFIAPQQS